MKDGKDRGELTAANRQEFVFLATDPVPPLNGPTFAAEDIEELGLAGCLKVWERINGVVPGFIGTVPDA